MRLALLAPILVISAAGAQPSLDSWFPRLQAGSWIKIEGHWAEGVLHASKIKLLATELDESEITCKIASVDAEARSLRTELGVTVVASHRTDVQGHGSERIPFASLKPGDQVECEGVAQRDGSFLAVEIDLKRPQHDRRDEEVEIAARVDSVDGTKHQIALLGVTVQMDAKTRNVTPMIE